MINARRIFPSESSERAGGGGGISPKEIFITRVIRLVIICTLPAISSVENYAKLGDFRVFFILFYSPFELIFTGVFARKVRGNKFKINRN